jgi:eukaryotic-like serine/threonine-protein kinase
VVHIMRQVCGALKEAHRAGLVHRDLKPSNVMVCRAGGPHDQAKLLDFGLVQLMAWEALPDERITRDGLIVGTPEYMSPEQAQGLVLDSRSDLFSLGSVMYFLLTGREVFHRDNPMKTLLAVVNEQPTGLLHVNPYLPADVAAVIAKCLAKPLDQRYASAGELEAALAACECANRWTEARCNEWWDHHPKADPSGTDLNSLPLQ